MTPIDAVSISSIAWYLDGDVISDTIDRVVGVDSYEVSYGSNINDPITIRFKNRDHVVAFKMVCLNGWIDHTGVA